VGELAADAGITGEELALAARNHAMPLEALRWPVTPVGLHYLLIHFDVPLVDPAAWRLDLGGRVRRPLSLTLDELRARPAEELVATMECAGNGRALLEPRPRSQPWLTGAVGTGRWRGVPLDALLAEAELADDAVELVLTGLDRGIDGGEDQLYARSLTPADAAGSLLAYELNGQPLPPQHGFPLRLVVPGWYGMTNVKWLASIEAVEIPFAGFQQADAYRLRRDEDEDGRPVTRMQPRALLAPPGIPDFFTRSRVVEPGRVLLEGRAWSGHALVARVEVSTDGGETWADAQLVRDLDSRWAWCGFRLAWDAVPGEHVLCCRAHDEAGNAQPLSAGWNVGGYENNAVQRLPVSVTGPA
jgi:DMSO/TMAO reductase YedYZ molybdopterin-dependent catalytic subunit